MAKLKFRLAFDLILTVMIVFEMLISLTGVVAHEIVGFSMFACILVHLVLSRRFFTGISRTWHAKRRTSAKQKAHLVIAILLLADMAVLAISSIAISVLLGQTGLDLAFLNPGGVMYPVHTISAYVLCALTVVHLAMHWSLFAKAIDAPYDPSRRRAIGLGVNAAAAVAAVALGITGASIVAGSGASTANANASQAGLGTDVGTAGSSSAQAPARPGRGGHGGAAQADNSASGSSSGASAGGSTGASGTSSGTSTGSSGTCPLCHKACNLSAPQCNRPAQEGLI